MKDEPRCIIALGVIKMASNLEPVDERTLLNRITTRADVFGGKPIVRNMRISVEMIINLMARGESQDDILKDFPDLEADDIRACLAHG